MTDSGSLSAAVHEVIQNNNLDKIKCKILLEVYF